MVFHYTDYVTHTEHIDMFAGVERTFTVNFHNPALEQQVNHYVIKQLEQQRYNITEPAYTVEIEDEFLSSEVRPTYNYEAYILKAQ